MALVNLPQVGEAKTITEVIDAVEKMRKEIEYLFQNIETDNLNSKYVTVIEAGKNEKGSYRKMSDGTLECWNYWEGPTNTLVWQVADVNGMPYYVNGTTWEYPVPFYPGTIVHLMASGDVGGRAAPEKHAAWHFDHTKATVESGILGLDIRNDTFTSHRSLYARGVWK